MNSPDQQSAPELAGREGATNESCDYTRLLATRELLAYLGIGRTTLHHLLREGLPCYRLGSARALRFRRADVDQWLEMRREGDRVATGGEGSSC